MKRIYELFTSKERLFAAVLVEHVEALEDRIRRATARVDGARERLHAIVWTRVRSVAERRTLSRLLLEESLSVGPEARRAYSRIAARTRAAFVEGVRARELRGALGPELLATMFEAAIRVFLVDKVLATEDDTTEAETAEVVDLLLDGFAAPMRARATRRRKF